MLIKDTNLNFPSCKITTECNSPPPPNIILMVSYHVIEQLQPTLCKKILSLKTNQKPHLVQNRSTRLLAEQPHQCKITPLPIWYQ